MEARTLTRQTFAQALAWLKSDIEADIREDEANLNASLSINRINKWFLITRARFYANRHVRDVIAALEINPETSARDVLVGVERRVSRYLLTAQSTFSTSTDPVYDFEQQMLHREMAGILESIQQRIDASA